ncbi:DUF6709 family protein [Acetonema longum]|uniref:Uncharacterized protein n=1 Tax=Acetonema longum DSM 6540 TaxID=1009370 RepID=F7NDA3_9FIRM|nr:DUF6709 family protein [Acetonema longum]EGO65935.1 hypothetical protein ALO_00050 [Acetonema longum DSM 6540]
MGNLFSAVNRLSLVLLVMGATLISVNYDAFITSFRPPVSFEALLEGQEVNPGSHVAGNVVSAFPPFASETTYTKYKNGSQSKERASGSFYVIPTAKGLIGLKTNENQVAAMDQLVEETLQYSEEGGAPPTTKVYIEGEVLPMEPKLIKYYKEYLKDSGFTATEIKAMGEPLLIQYTVFRNVQLMVAGGIIVILAGIGLIVRRYKQLSAEESEEYNVVS